MLKRFAAIMLLLTVLAGLCACGKQDADTVRPEETTAPAQEAAASDTDAQTPPASATDTQAVDMSAYNTAQEYIGRTVDELFQAIGEPTDRQYAASCEEENAEDGMLFYDESGFYIWSVRSDQSETVRAVYLNE